MISRNISRRALSFGGLALAALGPLALSAGCAGAREAAVRPAGRGRDYAALFDFIPEDMERSGVPGLSLAVIEGGEIVHDGAYGVTNSETGAPVTRDTLFEAASLSKPLFAYFVLLQVEKGRLDLDRPLYEYWPHPELVDDPRHTGLTARMVLAHASGLPNWRSDTGGHLSFLFEPGTRYGYSGEAYEYLKDALKHRLGIDDEGLQALFDAEVAAPIGADFLRYTWDASIPRRKAFGHRDGIPTDNDRHDMNFGASYSLNTTVLDYARFLTALIETDGRRSGAVERLLAIQDNMPAEEGEMHRSLGFPVKAARRGLRYYHSGNNGDFRAYCHFYPASGDGIVLFGNSNTVFSSSLAQRIVESLGDEWFYV